MRNLRRHINEEGLYRAVNAAVLICIGLFAMGGVLGIEAVEKIHLLTAFAALLCLAAVNLLHGRKKILLLLALFIFLGALTAVIGIETCIRFAEAYAAWCAGQIPSEPAWETGCQLAETCVIAAAAYLIQILCEKIKAVRALLAFAGAAWLLVCLFSQSGLSHLGVVFLLLYFVLFCAERLQEHWEKKRSGGLKEQMLYLMPFFAVYLVLMAGMPAPESPYNWEWAVNFYRQMKEAFEDITGDLFGSNKYALSLSGFSEDGDIGGNIREKEYEVMRIRAGGNLITNVYLSGKVFDTFDGRQWLKERHGEEMENFLDTAETLYAVKRLDAGYLKDYLRETNLWISYGDFSTDYVFVPLKTKRVEGSGKGIRYSFDGGDLILEKKRRSEPEYVARYYQLNAGTELYEKLLKSHAEADETFWDTIARDYGPVPGGKITQEQLMAYRETIYEDYLDTVPLSEAVSEYLKEITQGAENDVEKLQAIERELSSYRYTQTPGDLPEKVTNAGEFLDYFLLESREGYCVHFATAFVLLARAEGIPARYVQGFCVPIGQEQETAVLSNMAHSWPEVYLEGIGWIPFEPTPGYGKLRYRTWKVSDRKEVSSEPGVWDEAAEESSEEVLTEEEQEPEEITDTESPEWVWRLLLLSGGGILTGAVLLFAAECLWGALRYRRMRPEGRFREEVYRNLRILSWLGLRKEEWETLQEFRERIETLQGMPVLRFMENYEDIIYGNTAVRNEMTAAVRSERKLLWGLLKKEKKAAYIFYRPFILLPAADRKAFYRGRSVPKAPDDCRSPVSGRHA